MSVQIIKKLCRLHLAELIPALPTAYEGMPFEVPSSGLYQRLQFVVQQPDDPTLGLGYYRERLEMQLFIVGPAGVGTSEVDTYAEQLRLHFRKGTVMVQDSIRVHVLRTPKISGTAVVQNRVMIPVLIDIVGEIYSN